MYLIYKCFDKIICDTFSPTITVGALVCAANKNGITLASATLSFLIPYTRHCESTTAPFLDPVPFLQWQVHEIPLMSFALLNNTSNPLIYNYTDYKPSVVPLQGNINFFKSICF